MAGVFADLRVIDLSWGIAGPMTTMFMADNGADVIRIEAPSGDPFARQTGYRVWNRGKRSVRLDLRSDDGRPQFEELVTDVGHRRRQLLTRDDREARRRSVGIERPQSAASSPARSPPTASTPPIVTARVTTASWRPERDCSMTRKGRRGTAMEFICGRPGPFPEFDAPEGLVRGADRDGADVPADPVAQRRRHVLRHARDRRRVACSAGERSGSARDHITSARGARSRVPQLAARGGSRRPAVLDVADRLEVDRRSLRVLRWQVGSSLDAPPPLGFRGGRRGTNSPRPRWTLHIEMIPIVSRWSQTAC